MYKNKAILIIMTICFLCIVSCAITPRDTSINITVTLEDSLMHEDGFTGSSDMAVTAAVDLVSVFISWNPRTKKCVCVPVVLKGNQVNSDSENLFLQLAEYLEMEIDAQILISGDEGRRLLEILDTFSSSDVHQDEIESVTLINQRIASFNENAGLFLRDTVFPVLKPFITGDISEKTVKNFIRHVDQSEEGIDILPKMVIDINDLNSYVYEQEYLKQVFRLMEEGDT